LVSFAIFHHHSTLAERHRVREVSHSRRILGGRAPLIYPLCLFCYLISKLKTETFTKIARQLMTQIGNSHHAFRLSVVIAVPL